MSRVPCKNISMILVIDNYDSFTFNLVQYLGQCGADIEVHRNDKISLESALALPLSGILLSPGPCTPKESGVCLDILKWALAAPSNLVPIFAVCLGHEAIGEVTGSPIVLAEKIMHGKRSPISHDGKGLFSGMPNPFQAVRYHSLVIARNHPPAGFIVSATSTDDGEIMGVRHKSLPIEGVQFHPESVLTESGLKMVENFVSQTKIATAN